jgi:crotonobetaine/carnitine-CoA ligase
MLAKPELPKESWTLPVVLKKQAERYGSREFCSFDDGSSLSFEQLDRQTDALATAFADLGVQSGDRVFGLLPNSRELLLAMIATHKRGAIYVPVNTELKGAFLQHQFTNTEPALIIVAADLRPVLDGIDRRNVRVHATVGVGADVAPLPGTQAHRFDDLVETVPRRNALASPTPRDVCMIMFTSGTTGPAKGVLMPHALCFYYALSASRYAELRDSDCMYISMPLFHGTAALLQFYASLLVGARVYIVKRFSATSWLSDVRASGATVTYAVGVMPEFILKQPERPDDHQNSLRAVWSVPVSNTWGRHFEERFGVKIFQGYGMTEFSVCVWGKLSDPVVAGCAGRVVDDFFELRIVDPETDEPLPPGVVGEIAIRPKEPFVFMAGYYRMPDKTVEAWRNLWFHTGDAGYLTRDGQLFYVDRIRDRIRRRGENISAYEVEEVINSHHGVEQCAVVGVKIEGAGGEDEVMAFVIRRSKSLDARTLLDWCVPRMPRYAVPRFIHFVQDIERTASGKIRKQALRDIGVTAETWDREREGYVVPR